MDASEIAVLCTLGLVSVVTELAPAFQRESGHRLAVRFGPTNLLRPDIEAGAPFDLAVLTATAVDQLIAAGKMAQGTHTDIARCGVGITVPPGAPKPDISTVEGLRQTLLAADSIVFSGHGASGQHFASLLPGLGIEREVRAKAVIMDGLVAERVVTGEIALGVQQMSEILTVPGAVLVGPLPEAVQSYTTFSAGIAVRPRADAAARALLARLADPSTRALAFAKGMEPP